MHYIRHSGIRFTKAHNRIQFASHTFHFMNGMHTVTILIQQMCIYLPSHNTLPNRVTFVFMERTSGTCHMTSKTWFGSFSIPTGCCGVMQIDLKALKTRLIALQIINKRMLWFFISMLISLSFFIIIFFVWILFGFFWLCNVKNELAMTASIQGGVWIV